MFFDFEKPSNRDLTETISTLAHMSLFVIADLTDAKSIPQELQKIIPSLPSLPVQPIIQQSEYEYSMFKGFGGFLSVLPPYRYENSTKLCLAMEEYVIKPALDKQKEIAERRRLYEEQLIKI